MNYIFVFLILISVIFGAFNGNMQEVTTSMLDSSRHAVEICLGLIGVMALWLGVMKVAQVSGLIDKLAKLVTPIFQKIFDKLPKNSPAISDIALNFSANMLGLSNAATPFGLKAMEDLQKENDGDKEVATDSMVTLLAMNTAGFQLIPSGALAILVAAGSANPTEIILPALFVSFVSFIFAICMSKVLRRFFK